MARASGDPEGPAMSKVIRVQQFPKKDKPRCPSLQDLIWKDSTLHLPSRLVWYMVVVSSWSNKAYPKHETMMQKMSASCEEIDRALRTIVEQWKLFVWDRGKAAYLRILEPGETSRKFKARVQHTVLIEVGVSWILRDLLEEQDKDGTVRVGNPAPHSNKEFAKQLGCSPMSVSRNMGRVLMTGCFKRYNRRRNKPLYARFDEALYLLGKYEEDARTRDADGVNPYIEPVPDRLRTHTIQPQKPDSRISISRVKGKHFSGQIHKYGKYINNLASPT